MRITIRDVAREAEVSVATVSRVFNDSGPVRDAVRDRVAAVAARLRYTPNAAARSLTTNRTGVIGAVLPDLHGQFFSEVIRGLDQTAQQNEFHLLLSSSHNDRGAIESAVRAMHGRVDGLVIMAPGLGTDTFAGHRHGAMPMVLLNAPAHNGTFDVLGVDNYGGARSMTRHLAHLGHARIAMIMGPDGNGDAAERLRGYRAAMKAARAGITAQWEMPGDFTEAAGYDAVKRVLRTKPRPTAIFAANDAMAIGALSALREAGISVPNGMAVGGFDDIPLAHYVDPALTSVSVPMGRLGTRAIEHLLARLGDPSLAVKDETLPTKLIVRRSCGAATGQARLARGTGSKRGG